MLHHQQGIAEIPEIFQGIQQLVVIPLMQADAGLVQNIAYPDQSGADLGDKADSLRLTAGQGSCRP